MGLFSLAGGQAGSEPDVVGGESRVRLDQTPISPEEQNYRSGTYENFQDIRNNLIPQGPGASDVAAGSQAQRDLAALLDRVSNQYVDSNGMPTQEDINYSTGFANDIFKPREVAQAQSFREQGTDANRLAAQLGRSIDDPILQAKLRTGFMQQSDLLNADKANLAAQTAYQQPERRMAFNQYGLGLANQRAGVLSGLASQAFTNRAAIIGMGNQLENSNFNNRYNSAARSTTSTSGGGFKGRVEGATAGESTDLAIFGTFMGAGGGSGGGGKKQGAQGGTTGGQGDPSGAF